MSIKSNPNDLVDPKFIGIPYKLFGKDFDGCDCIGLTILWLRDQGVEYPYEDNKGAFTANWFEYNPRRLMDAMLSMGTIKKFWELKKYDCLLLYGVEQAMYPSCVATMIDDRHFLMATEERGSFVSMLDQIWKDKFWSGIRLNKVVDKWGL